MNDDHSNAAEDAGEDPFVELFMQFSDWLDAQNDKIDRLIELVDDMRIEMHRQREASPERGAGPDRGTSSASYSAPSWAIS